MKRNIFNYIKIILILFFFISIILQSNTIINVVLYSFEIWKNNIFTTLFPFFIFSDLLINYGFSDLISELTKNITTKIFHLPKEASFVIISSMLSGTPSSAKYTKELLDNNIISVEEANHLICFTHFPNPIFVLGTVSNFLNNKQLGYYILLSIIIGNLIIGIITRNKKINKKEKINIKKCINNINIKNKENNFIKILTNSIVKAIDTLLLLLGVITFYLILTTIISKTLNMKSLYDSILSGIFEMTQGIKKLAETNISTNLKAFIMTSTISFGGISIHSQIFSIIDNKNVRYSKYLLSRITHAALSGTIILLITNFFT